MNPLRSRQRKIYCALAIVVLFFLMLLHRPFVQKAAVEASVQTTNLGEVDLGGSITRFVLTSFRGPLICGLWWEARNAQARHEYEQMQLVIRALTKLQPHYKGPWRYEAWNLAYNVAVEFDSITDKYFFVTQGIRWLVDGERINRANLYDPAVQQVRSVGDPDMREEIGMYTQNKFSHADEHEIYRILLQLSCIPPERRDLNQLANNPQAMREFKAAYPRLVRRIRDYRYVAEGSADALDREILALLRAYEEIPALHPTRAEVAKGKDQPEHVFPFWPEDPAAGYAKPANPGLEDNQDSFDIARQWFEYSIEPLPATQAEIAEGKVKGSQSLTRNTSTKMSLIFRANPARAKGLQAQQQAKEGWGSLAQKAWAEASRLWRRFGTQTGLEIRDEEFAELSEKARYYQENYPQLAREDKPPPTFLQTDLEEFRRASDGYAASRKLKTLTGQRSTANYDYWRVASEFNSTDDYREARQGWYEAGRRRSDLAQALALYDQSMKHWRRILVTTAPMGLDATISHQMATLFTPGLAPVVSFLPLQWERQTPYGMHSQVQESLMALNEEYLKIAAITGAPKLLQSMMTAQEVASLIGRQVGSPAGFSLVGGLPISVSPLQIEVVEDTIKFGEGPFHPYVSAAAKETFRARERTTRQRIMEGPAAAPAGANPESKPAPITSPEDPGQ